MQRAHPRYITSNQSHVDPETDAVYDAGTPIPYEVGVRLGLVPTVEETQRSQRKGKNTARRAGANRMAPQGDDR